MEMAAIATVLVLAAFLAVLLRGQRPEQAMAVGIVAGVGRLIVVLMQIVPVFSAIKDLFETASIPEEYGIILFKGPGVCLIAQLAADACRDAGENALAAKAELAGKVALLTLALPVFQKISTLAVSLIKG